MYGRAQMFLSGKPSTVDDARDANMDFTKLKLDLAACELTQLSGNIQILSLQKHLVGFDLLNLV